jgi:hypothetical protein
MATLGKVLDKYNARFQDAGYPRRLAGERGPVFQGDDLRSVAYDRMKTGVLRCFLCLGEPPYIESETPWWSTSHAETIESAVEASWQFLRDAGFQFLRHPESLTPTQWRERYHILVRDYRRCCVNVTWPTAWSLNQVVMAAKRSVPYYARFSALEIRQRLADVKCIQITDFSLLDAQELATALRAEGFLTSITPL